MSDKVADGTLIISSKPVEHYPIWISNRKHQEIFVVRESGRIEVLGELLPMDDMWRQKVRYALMEALYEAPADPTTNTEEGQ